MKATEQYLPVVPFIMLYKVVLTFEFVDEIIKCDHSNECLTDIYERYFPMVRFTLYKKQFKVFVSGFTKSNYSNESY